MTMSILIRVVSFGILLSVQLSSIGALQYDAMENEFFSEHFRKHINYSIDPCDNFFRHVCSRTDKHVPIHYIRQLVKEMSKSELEVEDESRRQILSFCEKNIHKFESSLCKRLLIARRLMGARRYLRKHGYDSKEFLDTLSIITEELRPMIREQLEKNFQFGPETRQELLEELGEIEVLKFPAFTKYTPEYIENLYNELMETSLKMTPAQLVNTSLEDDNELELMLYDLKKYNALYLGGLVIIYDGYVPLLMRTDDFVKTVVLGAVFAHEMHHGLISTKHAQRDESYQKKRMCLESYTENACNVFHEENMTTCGGGKATFDEDGPDSESIQITFLYYKQRFGDLLEEKYYQDMTYKQLFFYALATASCDDFGTDRMHSSSFLRINSMMGLADSFIEAFQCKSDTRMAQLATLAGPDKCNFFGDVIRKK